MGKTMEEWCRFSVCFWHTFRGTGVTILFLCCKCRGMEWSFQKYSSRRILVKCFGSRHLKFFRNAISESQSLSQGWDSLTHRKYVSLAILQSCKANVHYLRHSGENCSKFALLYWFVSILGADPFGFPTISRHWDDGSNSLENAKRRLRAAFEFFEKLGVKYYTFHDR